MEFIKDAPVDQHGNYSLIMRMSKCFEPSKRKIHFIWGPLVLERFPEAKRVFVDEFLLYWVVWRPWGAFPFDPCRRVPLSHRTEGCSVPNQVV